MYIESYWVVIVAVVVVYLIWRVEHLKRVIQEAGEILNVYQKKKENLERDLVMSIISFDAKFVNKLSKKTRDKVLEDQANELRCHFKNNYAAPMYLDGKLVPIEKRPTHRLSLILDLAILDSDEDNVTVKDTNHDIKLGLEKQLDIFDD